MLTSHTSAPRKFIRFAGVRIRNLIKRRRRYSRAYSRERSYYFPGINLTSWRAPPSSRSNSQSPRNNPEPSFRQFSFFYCILRDFDSKFIYLFLRKKYLLESLVDWIEIWKWEETNILVFRLLLHANEYFQRKISVLVVCCCIVSEKRRYWNQSNRLLLTIRIDCDGKMVLPKHGWERHIATFYVKTDHVEIHRNLKYFIYSLSNEISVKDPSIDYEWDLIQWNGRREVNKTSKRRNTGSKSNPKLNIIVWSVERSVNWILRFGDDVGCLMPFPKGIRLKSLFLTRLWYTTITMLVSKSGRIEVEDVQCRS